MGVDLIFRHNAVNRLAGLGASLEVTAKLRGTVQRVLDDARAHVQLREAGPTEYARVARALDESGPPALCKR